MNTKLNLVLSLLIALFGLVALGAIIILSVYDKVVPNEVSALPSVALGGIIGLTVGGKLKTDEPV